MGTNDGSMQRQTESVAGFQPSYFLLCIFMNSNGERGKVYPEVDTQGNSHDTTIKHLMEEAKCTQRSTLRGTAIPRHPPTKHSPVLVL